LVSSPLIWRLLWRLGSFINVVDIELELVALLFLLLCPNCFLNAMAGALPFN
jgi:hypothetical protein